MIINCNNCNKNFDVQDHLIPAAGRLLKCGYCDNKWFFKPSKSPLIEDAADVNILKNPVIKDRHEPKKNINENLNIPISENKIEKEKIQANKNSSEKKVTTNKLLNYLFIILISLAAIILLADTFKVHLSSIFPNIIPVLDSLYETLFDLKLFIKDLFN